MLIEAHKASLLLLSFVFSRTPGIVKGNKGPPLFGLYPNGLYPNGLFMIGLSPFGLPMMFGLSPFGLF